MTESDLLTGDEAAKLLRAGHDEEVGSDVGTHQTCDGSCGPRGRMHHRRGPRDRAPAVNKSGAAIRFKPVPAALTGSRSPIRSEGLRSETFPQAAPYQPSSPPAKGERKEL